MEGNHNDDVPPRRRAELHYQSGCFRPTDFVGFLGDDRFHKDWSSHGLDDEDLNACEIIAMLGPNDHPEAAATGGMRYFRYRSTRSDGPDDAVTVFYVYFEDISIIHWLAVAFGHWAIEQLIRNPQRIAHEIEQIRAELDSE